MYSNLPPARTWIWAAILTLGLGLASAYVQAGNPIVALALMGFAGILGFAGLLFLWHWLGMAWADISRAFGEAKRTRREAESITQYSRILEAAAKVPSENASIIPRLEAANLGSIAWRMDREGKLHDYFITPGGLIPWEFVAKFVAGSSLTGMYPVNRTSDKTMERGYIQWFTEWCTLEGYLLPYDGGPRPAQWVIPESRAILAGRLGIELPGLPNLGGSE